VQAAEVDRSTAGTPAAAMPRLFPWSITADADRKDRDIGFPLAAARFFCRQASRTDTHQGQAKIGALITSTMQRDRRKPAFSWNAYRDISSYFDASVHAKCASRAHPSRRDIVWNVPPNVFDTQCL